MPVRGKPNEPCTATREHMQPKLYGGTFSKGNIRAACLKCNNERGQKMMESIKREHHNIFGNVGSSVIR
jgi:hypothetical protein